MGAFAYPEPKARVALFACYILSGAEIPIKSKVFLMTCFVAKTKAKRAVDIGRTSVKTRQSR